MTVKYVLGMSMLNFMHFHAISIYLYYSDQDIIGINKSCLLPPLVLAVINDRTKIQPHHAVYYQYN